MMIGGKEAPDNLNQAYDMVHALPPEAGLVLTQNLEQSWAQRISNEQARSRDEGLSH